MIVEKLKLLKDRMTKEQKRRFLKALREYQGNIGGETDIVNADNPLTNENEYTSGNRPPERNVIAKTFDTEADFDSYVNQRRGLEITPKEFQSVENYTKTRPTHFDKFHLRYEITDDFGNNDTTIIKKLKEVDQFCWTAFSKHETAEEEGSPSLNEVDADQSSDTSPEQPTSDEPADVIANDPIRITKSITFTDDEEGANALSDFLLKLDL